MRQFHRFEALTNGASFAFTSFTEAGTQSAPALQASGTKTLGKCQRMQLAEKRNVDESMRCL
jgi:hypothetical protein